MTTSEQDLRALLPRFNAAIEREIYRLRGRYELSLDEFRGLYVSDAQVDALLRAAGVAPDGTPLPPAGEPGPRWRTLAARFDLDATDQDILCLAVMVEIDTRYTTLFAYLNDDAARKRPSVDLAMRLLADGWESRATIRARLSPGAPLVRLGLIGFGEDPPGALLSSFVADPLVVLHLLGGDALSGAGLKDADPAGAADKAERRLSELLGSGEVPAVVLLAGRAGTGRRDCAARTAAAMQRRLAILPGTAPLSGGVAWALKAARIEGAALLIEAAEPTELLVAAARAPGGVPLFFAVPDAASWERALSGCALLVRRFAISSLSERREQWRAALRTAGVRTSPGALDAVATRFRLSGGAIRRAAQDIALALDEAGAAGSRQASPAQLSEAARRQCAIDLGHLATRIDARPGWDDLVLPSATRALLRDFAGAGQQRDRVYGEWGMGQVGRGAGGGVIALFAGASGTGKTMSAAVIACATGLDLWRIDLSAVVSKYIGETEKNLDRIFTAARDGDAILFFDEADALFGKRSEVKDARDRYANVEVAYLLQRLEDHDGIAILASNFSRNIDQAFVRRLHYIIEFPLPDATLRERLWRKAFAARTPIRGSIDQALLARQFALSGGEIRAAALDATFLAANDGGAVTMEHVLRAVSRQMLKQARLPGRHDGAGWRRADGEAPAATVETHS